jgi:hypothetical protein
MKKLTLSLLTLALSTAAHAQTPAAAPATPGTATAPAAAAAPKKPLAPGDKKFIKDASEAILLEQKFLEVMAGYQGATIAETTTRNINTMKGDLKRILTALDKLSQEKGGELAKEIAKTDASKADRLAKEKPDKFEKEFFKDLSKETKVTAKVFESSKTLQDADLKKFADDWLVTIKDHDTKSEAAEKAASAPKKK